MSLGGVVILPSVVLVNDVKLTYKLTMGKNSRSKRIKFHDSSVKGTIRSQGVISRPAQDVRGFTQAERKLKHYIVARDFSQAATMTFCRSMAMMFRHAGVVEVICNSVVPKCVVSQALSQAIPTPHQTRVGHKHRSKVKFSGEWVVPHNESLSSRVLIRRGHYSGRRCADGG